MLTSDEKKTPLISILTPSFNCVAYIRQCIESVLNQHYAHFEHIIVDNVSTDGTLDTLKEYTHLKWISEPDKGEAEALNKAFKMSKGDIIGWLNADDFYSEGVFHQVVQQIDPLNGRHVVYGKANLIDELGKLNRVVVPTSPVTLARLVKWFDDFGICQPSIFYSRPLVDDVGYFREDLFFSVDYDYWLRAAAKGYQFHFIDQALSSARLLRANSKSTGSYQSQQKSWSEVSGPYLEYLSFFERLIFWVEYFCRYKYPIYRSQVTMRLALRTRMRKFIKKF